MLFNSFEFLIFLPLVFFLYWFAFKKNLKLQNLFLILASYIFYAWWDWRFLILIIFTSFSSYFSGLLIEKYNNKDLKTKAKLISTTNVIINLGILFFFKYFNFFQTSFIDAFAQIGIILQPSTLRIILPIGISFYTFQAVSYSVDIYKKKIQATKDPLPFFAFISFFPQLLAGPIARATTILPQFIEKRKFDYSQSIDGLRQVLWGLFKKVVIADTCAVYVNQIFSTYQTQSSSTLILGAIFYSIQIYGDFAGYSDIAIGIARLFGFNLAQNFNMPYFSRDIAEFWRRWHITLNTWFRDYLYIPLGGNRGSKWQSIRNTLIIFTVSGFWHGANWTFIIWGAFHGLLFLPLLLGGNNKKFKGVVAENTLLPSFNELWHMLLTFFLVTIGWIIFRADNISQAFQYIVGMFSKTIFTIPYTGEKIGKTLILISALFITEWFQRKKQHGLDLSNVKQWWIRYAIYYTIISLVIFYSGQQQAFIYFQF